MSQMPRKRFWEEPKDPLVAATSRLTIRKTPVPASNTHQAQQPMWGQIKKSTQMVEESLKTVEQPVTMSNLTVAMMAVLTITVSIPPVPAETKNSYTYWAYIPFPPLLWPVTWLDLPVEVYTNDSFWIPGSTDDRGPSHPKEEGMIMNISLGFEHLTICLGKANGYLPPSHQSWLAIVPECNIFMAKLHMLSVLSIYCNDYAPVTEVYCPQKPVCIVDCIWSEKMKGFAWEDCIAGQAELLCNDSYGAIIDWSHKGAFMRLTSQSVGNGHPESKENDQMVDTIRSTAKVPIIWTCGIVAPQPQMMWPAVGAKHKELWKILMAL
uniref:endogenous retrovirus group K member 19 Env polyprotein-like n=1 Tax=Macaca mulatta TaxID=9544 RepID=UPI00073274BC|nr:endogenous retrovirus group K member 19 Env polyprotein-like [Macaca mulatta]